jgi:hypothetical protein
MTKGFGQLVLNPKQDGIPSHDTFGRVFSRLDPQELHNSFLGWVNSITEKLGLSLIHIDGKTAKGSYDREEKLKALHSVSAWRKGNLKEN